MNRVVCLPFSLKRNEIATWHRLDSWMDLLWMSIVPKA